MKKFKFTKEKKGKIQTFVEFPLIDLNLSKFIKSPQKETPIYDLFAISVKIKFLIFIKNKKNHKGSLGGGHYTSFAKNKDNKCWYLYNDNFVEKIDPPFHNKVFLFLF